MKRKKASDFDPEVLNLFDRYVHGMTDRRGFLDGAAKYAVGGMTAAALLEALNPKYAEAQQVSPNDDRLRTEYLEYPSGQGNGTMRGYLVRRADSNGNLPGVLVVHENRGLSTRISKTSPGALPWRGFWPLLRMPWRLSAVTRAMTMMVGNCSANAIAINR